MSKLSISDDGTDCFFSPTNFFFSKYLMLHVFLVRTPFCRSCTSLPRLQPRPTAEKHLLSSNFPQERPCTSAIILFCRMPTACYLHCTHEAQLGEKLQTFHLSTSSVSMGHSDCLALNASLWSAPLKGCRQLHICYGRLGWPAKQ